MHEPGRCQRRLDGVKVGTANQDINVLGVANGSVVDATDPFGGGIATDYRLRHSGLPERCAGSSQAFFDLLHGEGRPLPAKWCDCQVCHNSASDKDYDED